MASGNPRQQARQHRELACEDRLEHASLGGFQHRRESRARIADLPPGLVERVLAAIVDQDACDGIERLIARSAVNAGEGPQLLVLAENLLDDHIKRRWL